MTSLSQEEKNLLQSVENEEWVSVKNLTLEKQRYQSYAQHQMLLEKIEILLSPEDGQKIKELASRRNKSVPRLTEEILHKYLQGELDNSVSFD
ncbi:hypothetical protein [Gloeocapsa sp. PCC 73106]|uniref:hypothetical protein n=1 Tax=Gloeocapsa sp. PCC 73106 TaxID=102232 RepID=UPI0002ACDC36|nr:hypothetical protein [Gloeocapsa sp. PCC 73106]ELR99996.1 hypothetical protein GLO73106DRAFT_00038500 [Gloeocapsa sp. PCC 73106]